MKSIPLEISPFKIDNTGYNKYIVKTFSLSSSRSSLSLLTIISLLLFSQVSAQIEFVENKGQWNKNIDFQTKAGSGAFFIEHNGFTVLSHNEEDMEVIGSMLHGHSVQELINSKSPVSAKTLPIPDDMKLRSHAYKVKFEVQISVREFLINHCQV